MSDWNTPSEPEKPAEPEYLAPPGRDTDPAVHHREEALFPVGVYDDEQRQRLLRRLTDMHIAFRLDDAPNLYVPVEDASIVAGYISDLSAPPAPPSSFESSVPVHYHDAPDAETTETPAETESWFNPPPVEPESVEAHEPPLPEHLHEQTLGDLGAGPSYRDPRHAMDEVAFLLDGFSTEQREHLFARLAESNTPVRVEDDTLYGRIDDASLIEGYVADLSGREDVEEVIAEADDDDDEIVFDLSSMSSEERRHLSMRLTGAGISHLWEVATDLVVSVTDAPAIERYIDEVRNPDGFGDEELASFEEDSDVDDEAVYGAMSNLYVAADKLMQRPGDDATAGEFYVAVDDVDGLPAPFGFDPRVWSQVQDLANKIADTLDDEGDTEVIGTDARTLRQLLANYV